MTHLCPLENYSFMCSLQKVRKMDTYLGGRVRPCHLVFYLRNYRLDFDEV